MPSSRPLPGATSPKLAIPVTDEIIDRSIPRDSGHCMLADAVKAWRPAAKFIAVDLATIRFTEGGRRYIYLTPRTAQRALIQFDHGERPEPFTLRLRHAQVMTAGHNSPREPAELVINPAGGGTIPVRVNGKPPPSAPLSNVGSNRGNRTGRRREFGLRAILK